MSQSDKSLKTTRKILVVGLAISVLLSLGLIALMWFGYAIITVPLIGGFLIALLASYFLKGENSNRIAWIIFVTATIISVMLLMVGGGLAG
jgi:asparagine N-glycosylation enzyme membrane subunit Stt3